jgi:MFS family permease
MTPLHLTFAIGFLSFTAMTASRVVLSLYALKLGADASAVGVLAAMFFIFPLFLSWPVGALSDRIGPRRPLLASAIVAGAGLVVPYFWQHVAALYIGAAMTGLALSLYHVNLQTLVGRLSTPTTRVNNFANFSLVGATTNFAGPLFGGMAVDQWGHGIACLGIAGLSAVALGLILGGGRSLPRGERSTAPKLRVMDTLADRGMRGMLVTSGLMQLGTDLFQFYMPIYGHGAGMSASAIGTILAAFAAAAFCIRFGMARLVALYTEQRLLTWSFFVGALGFMLIPVFQGVVLLSVVAFIFGLGMGCGQPLTTMLMFARCAEGRTGETLGLRLTVNNTMRVAGPALFGVIASMTGLTAVFIINGVMMGIGGWMSRAQGKAK